MLEQLKGAGSWSSSWRWKGYLGSGVTLTKAGTSNRQQRESLGTFTTYVQLRAQCGYPEFPWLI